MRRRPSGAPERKSDLVRRLRTSLLALATAAAVLATSACGDDTKAPTSDAIASVTVSGGDAKADPTITVPKTPLTVTQVETKVLTEGTGSVLTAKDLLSINAAIVNGKDGKLAHSTFKTGAVALDLSDVARSTWYEGYVDQLVRHDVADLAEVRDGVARLNGRIRAVEVHSAPRRSGTAEALAASLAELAAWHWCGATLVVEHCDAWRDDDTAQKGFLPFADELDVVAAVDGQTPVRIGINWARSVIESHDPAAPERQLEAAVARGLLGALMFSSVSDRPTAFGPAWLDAHLAPADTTGAEPGTLLTEARLRRCVQALGPAFDGVLGVKVGLKPDTLAAADRVSRLLEVVALVVEARR